MESLPSEARYLTHFWRNMFGNKIRIRDYFWLATSVFPDRLKQVCMTEIIEYKKLAQKRNGYHKRMLSYAIKITEKVFMETGSLI
jgi:hypothetical protein